MCILHLQIKIQGIEFHIKKIKSYENETTKICIQQDFERDKIHRTGNYNQC